MSFEKNEKHCYFTLKYFSFPGLSKGVGFIRFDQRQEAERAIQE